MTNFNFTFKTDEKYHDALSFGSIEKYDIVRVRVFHDVNATGYNDFPVHTEEDFKRLAARLDARGAKWDAYPAKHYYEIEEFIED